MSSRWGKQPERIVVANDRFEVFRGNERIGWAGFEAIVLVEAYKRDELTVDLLCFDIAIAQEPPLTWFIHEEAIGWQTLIEALERLPGFDVKWREKVNQPAFGESRTVVYDQLAKLGGAGRRR